MKRHTGIMVVAIGLIFSVTNIATAIEVQAKGVKTYGNCKELNKDYKGGVARSATVKNKGGKTKYKPFVSKELYDANQSRDRDKDLIACER
ncbi:excalibur calcium-binding domain-containing protein [Paenibacillus sp. YPG26]|uniref:excalibur calcium-binding domain-containing protein n=1 Tax=Paenibacillus sp. YPG26 TaxID=2878915 RepID=UPI00204128F7|nr:excalibur calcium-binding domain-containing protein [Paenibacillus sp. YPG26]USB33205.1 excalibur calcium-binding domain-containing protein [Paenibacillus sp. YPG26]